MEPELIDQPPAPDGREAELVRLLTEGHRRLLAYVSSLVGNRHDAEDVLQRATVLMWRQFHTFELGTDFIAWATTVAHYEARNFLRIAGRAKVAFDDNLLNLISAERRDDVQYVDARAEALEHCVGKLDESNRELILAVYGQDVSIVRLAGLLGKTPKTLYNRLTAIRHALADCIERRMSSAT